jgi:hypothetical protein
MRDLRSLRSRYPSLLDSWQFWVGIAYFGLTCVVVALWIAFGRVSADQAKTADLDARRHADIVATAESQYTQCVRSIPVSEKVNKFVAGVQELGDVLLVNSISSHGVARPGSLLYDRQAKNISRLRDALKKVRAVKAFPVPSVAKCIAIKQKEESKK